MQCPLRNSFLENLACCCCFFTSKWCPLLSTEFFFLLLLDISNSIAHPAAAFGYQGSVLILIAKFQSISVHTLSVCVPLFWVLCISSFFCLILLCSVSSSVFRGGCDGIGCKIDKFRILLLF
jgi:hypothetical protein